MISTSSPPHVLIDLAHLICIYGCLTDRHQIAIKIDRDLLLDYQDGVRGSHSLFVSNCFYQIFLQIHDQQVRKNQGTAGRGGGEVFGKAAAPGVGGC